MNDILDTLNKNTTKDSDTGCWLYTKRIEKSGYAQIHFRFRTQRVHRVSAHIYLDYDLTDKLQVNHKCKNKNCWNPEHLYIGTQQENVYDTTVGLKSHCVRGHEYTPENTIKLINGKRICRECNQIRNSNHSERW